MGKTKMYSNKRALAGLWKAITYLPTVQIIGIIGAMVGILIATYTLSRLIEHNSAKYESFELKTENRELKATLDKMSERIGSLANTVRL